MQLWWFLNQQHKAGGAFLCALLYDELLAFSLSFWVHLDLAVSSYRLPRITSFLVIRSLIAATLRWRKLCSRHVRFQCSSTKNLLRVSAWAALHDQQTVFQLIQKQITKSNWLLAWETFLISDIYLNIWEKWWWRHHPFWKKAFEARKQVEWEPSRHFPNNFRCGIL